MATSRSAERRRLRRGAVVLAVLLGAVLLTLLTVSRAPVSAGPAAAPVAQQQLDDAGREVYLRDCAWCHGPEGAGTQFGPTLEEAGPAAADFWLRTGRMPLEQPEEEPERGPPAYDEETIEALVSHVATLGDGLPIPSVAAGDPVAGRSLFLTNCAPCHSASGTGMILSGGHYAPELYETEPTQVAEAVRLGPGAMPEFPESHLDEQDVDDVVTYVALLGPRQVEGGYGLDQYGPILEGLFVWLVIVPALLVLARLLGKRARR